MGNATSQHRRRAFRWLTGSGLAIGAVGCTAGPQHESYPPPSVVAASPKSGSPIALASHQEPGGTTTALPAARNLSADPLKVDELVGLAVARNPRLGRAAFNVNASQGKYVQAGLYPNPDLAVNWDEIGDRTGAGGILNVPRFTQQIVTGHKLSLAQAVAATEVNQATLAVLTERYSVIGAVRAAFYDVYALERRVAILDELVLLAGEATKNGKALLDNKQIARLDLIQLEVELGRFRAEAEATRRELPAARKRLAAAVGDPRIPIGPIAGAFDEVPAYDLDKTLEAVLATHPEARSARVGVERAQAAIRRAEAEPIPNVTFTTGFIKQYENRSNDFALGLSAPIPVWNRNQGNILAAKAELGAAIQDVGRVENDLTERVSTAVRTYAAAVKRAEQYRTEILPKADETYKLSLEAFKGGQFEYLRVIQAQRVVAEARLEYNRSLGEAWRAAAELSAFLLEEWWPGPFQPPAGPALPPNPFPPGPQSR